MKRRIASMILTSVLVAVMGCNTSTASTSNVSCSMTCNNISIINDIKDNIHVYHSKTKEDFDRLTSIIENRNGKIIIKMVDATVLNDDGNGSDSFGFYVKYDSGRFSKGDKVRSVFVYNPKTNYLEMYTL